MDIIEDFEDAVVPPKSGPPSAVDVRIVGDESDRDEAAQYYSENTFQVSGAAAEQMQQILAQDPNRKIARVSVKAGAGGNTSGYVIMGPAANVGNRQGGVYVAGETNVHEHSRAVFLVGDGLGDAFTVTVHDERYAAKADPAPAPRFV